MKKPKPKAFSYADIERAKEIRDRLERLGALLKRTEVEWRGCNISNRAGGDYDYLPSLFRDPTRSMRDAINAEIARLRRELSDMGVQIAATPSEAG